MIIDLIKIFKRNYAVYGLNKKADFALSWMLVSPILIIIFGADLWLGIYSINLFEFQVKIKDKTIE